MKKIISTGFPFSKPMQAIRKVRWEQLPLGCVILEWTVIHGASIPELTEYPVITERLRSHLRNKYQFLQNTKITIADPDSGIDRLQVVKASRDARIIRELVPKLEAFRLGQKKRWMNEPDVRQGLGQIGSYDSSPYMLTRDWVKSLGTVIREDCRFASDLWSPGVENESPGEIMARLISDGIRLPDSNESVVHLGLDVSFSMTSSGKAHFLFNNLQEILTMTAGKLKTSTWNFWLLSNDVSSGDWTAPLVSREDLEKMLKKRRVDPANTNFAPFFRRVLEQKNRFRHNLCILLTDGACQDRPASLRMAEKLAEEGIDYLQLVVHRDDEYRDAIITEHPEYTTDGVIPEELLSEEDTRYTRDDEELREYCDGRLKEITDIAEAARGGQLILTWYPLFSYLALDVYSRYLGKISLQG